MVDKNVNRLIYFQDVDVKVFEKLPNLEEFSIIIETTGISEIGQQIIGQSANGVKILLLGLPYNDVLINIENLVTADKKVIGSVGSSGNEFREAIEMIPHINLNHMDECVYEFTSWKAAWKKHKTKSELKVKLNIAKDQTDK